MQKIIRLPKRALRIMAAMSFGAWISFVLIGTIQLSVVEEKSYSMKNIFNLLSSKVLLNRLVSHSFITSSNSPNMFQKVGPLQNFHYLQQAITFLDISPIYLNELEELQMLSHIVTCHNLVNCPLTMSNMITPHVITGHPATSAWIPPAT